MHDLISQKTETLKEQNSQYQECNFQKNIIKSVLKSFMVSCEVKKNRHQENLINNDYYLGLTNQCLIVLGLTLFWHWGGLYLSGFGPL